MLPTIAMTSAVTLLAAGTGWCQFIGAEEAKLTASDAGQGDWFGLSISISGDTALVGAPYDTNSGGYRAGSAYVFTRNGPTWAEEAKLHAPSGMPFDLFGWSVSISGDTAVIGAFTDDRAGNDAGAAYVFVRRGSTWSLEANLTASDANPGDNFGISVALTADMAVIGANLDNHSSVTDAGSAYVFTRSGASWTEQAKLTASDSGDSDYFGSAVGISGDAVAVIGAPADDVGSVQDTGSAYVFARKGTTWSQEAKLTANTGTLDLLGGSVAIFGDTVVVGAPGGYSLVYPGAAYVFERRGTTWTEMKKLVASDGKGLDQFGQSVSVRGGTIVIGAPYDDLPFAGADAGSAHVFVGSGTTWNEDVKLTASDGRADDIFGWSAALSADTVVVGTPWDKHGGLVQAGSAYVFRLSTELPANYCRAGISASGCRAAIVASGTPSATASSGFRLSAAAVEGQKDGLFFFGINGQQANPWGNGTSYQCVVPPVVRAPLMTGTGTVGLCDGSFTLDFNALWCPTCPKPGKNPGTGAIVQVQLWYRDPLNASNQTTSLSDAIKFGVGP